MQPFPPGVNSSALALSSSTISKRFEQVDAEFLFSYGSAASVFGTLLGHFGHSSSLGKKIKRILGASPVFSAGYHHICI